MKARLLFHDKVVELDGGIIEVKIWALVPTSDRPHGYKYSFVYIRNGQRVVGYDNSEGKGDHRHYGGLEVPYRFTSIERLVEDFLGDVGRIKGHES